MPRPSRLLTLGFGLGLLGVACVGAQEPSFDGLTPSERFGTTTLVGDGTTPPETGPSSGPGAPGSVVMPTDLHDLHRVMIGNDGQLRTEGKQTSTPEELEALFQVHFPRFADSQRGPKILIHVHGGLVSEADGLAKIATYRTLVEPGGVYPLLFVWRSGILESLGNMFQDTFFRKKAPASGETKAFLSMDGVLEGAARALGVKALWDEIKENALLASTAPEGGARLVADHLARLKQRYPDLEVHLTGHSAGSILLGPFVELLAERGVTIRTLILQSPAASVDHFKQYYVPAIRSGAVERAIVFNLTDAAERADTTVPVYGKSILYLVSRALETTRPTPLIGLETSIRADPEIMALTEAGKLTVALSPNSQPIGSAYASYAQDHVEAGGNLSILLATQKLVLGDGATPGR